MITFKKTHDPSNQYDNTDVTIESHSQTVTDILEDFKCFLMACGYPVDFNDTIHIEKDET